MTADKAFERLEIGQVEMTTVRIRVSIREILMVWRRSVASAAPTVAVTVKIVMFFKIQASDF